MSLEQTNNIIYTLVVAAQVIVVILVVYLLFFKKYTNHLINFITQKAIILALLIALLATLSSLYYSEIAGFAPCELCWWQRIFMFPSFFLFSVALWDKDRKVVRYVAPLIFAGFLVSAMFAKQ